jgi:hypothetical protein
MKGDRDRTPRVARRRHRCGLRSQMRAGSGNMRRMKASVRRPIPLLLFVAPLLVLATILFAVALVAYARSHRHDLTTAECTFPRAPVPACSTARRLSTWERFYAAVGATPAEAGCLAAIATHQDIFVNDLTTGPLPEERTAMLSCIGSPARLDAVTGRLVAYATAHGHDVWSP